ncbi:MAG: hypothetical protein IJ109_05855 [Firmicutes bacterium]|nr:hypothetical protein [Bacillota bacterium]
MNRTRKNIIMIVIAVLLAAGMVFTAHRAAGSLAGPPGIGEQPQMQGGPQSEQRLEQPDQSTSDQNSSDQSTSDQRKSDQNSSDQSAADNNTDNHSGAQPPAPPDGSTPPDGSGDQSSTSQGSSDQGNSGNQSPSPPDGNGGPRSGDQSSSSQGSSNQNGGPGSSDQGSSNQINPTHNGGPGGHRGGASLRDISAPYYILFGAEGLAFALILLQLIFSNMNQRTLRETFRSRKRLAAYIIAAVLLAGCLTGGQAALTTKVFAGGHGRMQEQMQGSPGGPENQGSPGGQESSIEATGATTVDGTEETLNDEYTSTNADENAILVTNGGTLTSDGATINKESGDSSNTESSDFSGVNAGLLVQENSTATVKNATITTSAKGANAVFSTGENSKITISDSTITTSGESSSRGLDATYGGTIEADKVSITTQGGSCAAMATDRGEGTVSAANSTLETNGAGSPLIYSTGNITLTDSKGTANGAQITVVEGKNSAAVENSKLTCSGAGNRGDVDIAGVMIYQSMSGDADEGTGNFTAKDSVLSISKDSSYYKTAPMFFVTNTDAVIDLTNTELNFGSGVLLSAQGTSEWGTEGSNGGNVTLKAAEEKLTGDIQLDGLSSLSMKLTDSTYEGTINGDNEAGSVALTLDKDSRITLTGDSYVSSLEDADGDYSNIDFNGHKLYVDGKAIN